MRTIARLVTVTVKELGERLCEKILYLVKNIKDEIHKVRIMRVLLIRSIENIGVRVIGEIVGEIVPIIRISEENIINEAEICHVNEKF
jgi:hypothetical protein